MNSSTNLDFRNTSLQSFSWKQIERFMQELWGDDPMFHACKKASSVLKNKASIVVARYHFGEDVFANSEYRLPSRNGDALEGNCEAFTAAEISIGVPLDRLLEVYLPGHIVESTKAGYANGYRSDRPKLLRALLPGECFGVFETVDRLLVGDQRTVSPWCISAGSRCSRLIYPLKSRATQGKIQQEFRNILPKRLEGPLEDWTWKLIEAIARTENWDAKVLFFTRAWEECAEWREAVFGKAWLTQRVDNTNEVRREQINQIVELNLNSFKTAEPEWIVELLLTLDRVADRRSCVFVPFQLLKHFDIAGPFENVLEKIRVAIGNSALNRNSSKNIPSHPVILSPKYLDDSEMGIVSLQRGVWSNSTMFTTKEVQKVSLFVDNYKDDLKVVLPNVDWNSLYFVAPNQTQAPAGGLIHARELLSKTGWLNGTNSTISIIPTGRSMDSTHPFISSSIIVGRSTNV